MSDSPAVVLRQAAARVRETGAACEPSVIGLRGAPWHTEECAVDLSPRAITQSAPSPDERAQFRRSIAEAESPELAVWIALMHPGLAEPLARTLEQAADALEGTEPDASDPDITNPTDAVNRAVRVYAALLSGGVALAVAMMPDGSEHTRDCTATRTSAPCSTNSPPWRHAATPSRPIPPGRSRSPIPAEAALTWSTPDPWASGSPLSTMSGGSSERHGGA